MSERRIPYISRISVEMSFNVSLITSVFLVRKRRVLSIDLIASTSGVIAHAIEAWLATVAARSLSKALFINCWTDTAVSA